MVKAKPLESSWQAILDITLVPAVARLPAAVRAERRDVAARRALLSRIHSEFEEMPGLTLTLAQAVRLFGISSDACARIFSQLNEEGLLQPSRNGGYARRLGQP